MSKLQIKRICPKEDPEIRVYFSRQKLTETIYVAEVGTPGEGVEDPFLCLLLSIPGVYIAECHQYHIAVRKSPMHEWTEIEPHLLQLLSAFNLGEGQLEKEAD